MTQPQEKSNYVAKPKAKEIKRRIRCLGKCGKMFISTSKFIRLCDRCKKND